MPESPEKSTRNLSFGSVAADYERYRLEYPDDVVDAVLRSAGGPVRSALEVGAGTGKATRRFAARGLAVTALEPDPRMAEMLATTTRELPVTPIVSTFEAFSTADRFDLVYAAASWHWVDPAVRTAHAAELLAPGGVLALIGMLGDLADPGLSEAVDAIERRAFPSRVGNTISPWSIEELTGHDAFTDVEQRTLQHPLTSTPDEFIGRLGTVSAYLMLDPDERVRAFDRIRAVLPDRFELDGAVQLVLARRR
ncbi:MAG TPA: methyltransferase domain-containing protein [Amnibacterium sp.]|uniref:class I SAM-dependent methyltransferase n=1 Tax=Amnibacterium sp. TaxID=1872496 RepID=UPI002F956BCA